MEDRKHVYVSDETHRGLRVLAAELGIPVGVLVMRLLGIAWLKPGKLDPRLTSSK